MRKIALTLTVVAVIVSPAALAHAAVPEHGTFDDQESGTDPAGTTCSFAVDFRQDEAGRYTVFFDAAGEFVRVVIHITYDATISANGHVLSEHDTYTRTIYADGTMRDEGLTAHVQGPAGLVIRDAGRIVYSDTDETVSYVRGPHPQLFGADFCAALAA
jgi:hypothetical protein